LLNRESLVPDSLWSFGLGGWLRRAISSAPNSR